MRAASSRSSSSIGRSDSVSSSSPGVSFCLAASSMAPVALLVSFRPRSSSTSSSLFLYLVWSTLIILFRIVAPPRLSTARSVLRWSSYLRNAKPFDFPVSLSRIRLTNVGSPNCENIVMMSPSDSSKGSPPI
jgi:hypothetical protein